MTECDTTYPTMLSVILLRQSVKRDCLNRLCFPEEGRTHVQKAKTKQRQPIRNFTGPSVRHNRAHQLHGCTTKRSALLWCEKIRQIGGFLPHLHRKGEIFPFALASNSEQIIGKKHTVYVFRSRGLQRGHSGRTFFRPGAAVTSHLYSTLITLSLTG
jgi:hypothetical protein